MTQSRTIISALYPSRFTDDCAVYLKVWFDELSGPVYFMADPSDSEPHGRELWIRAMAGEYGPVELLDPELRPFRLAPPRWTLPAPLLALLPPPKKDDVDDR